MIRKTIILLCFALCVLGDGHHAVSEQHIKIIHEDHKEHSKEHHGHHGELSHIGSNEPEHHEEYAWSYPSFEFSYKVHDPHSHDMKGQHESRKGDEVKGEYWLIEPDGRKRTVTYHADKHSGFHAIVHYSDDHHHIHHEDKKEEEIKDEIKEEKKDDEPQEEKVEDKNEAAPVEEKHEEEVHNAEENHDQEEVGKWIHDRHWGYHGSGKHHDYKHHEEHKHDHHYRDGGHKRDEVHKDLGSIIIIKNLGKHGHLESHNRPAWYGHDNKYDKDEKSEEESRRRSEHREYNGRSALPSSKSGAIVRENYYHPRFYRHHQRNNVNQ